MKKRFIIPAAASILLAAVTMARAATVEELQRRLDELSGQVETLRAERAAPPAEPATRDEGYLKGVWDRTRIGGYGELDYIMKRENGNGKGGNTFDPHRFVLYVNSELADWVTLNTELEWEHGGVRDELNSAGELSGEVTVEQAFLDFTIARPFNVKAGIMLVPLGATNLYHEPTNFNSSERPALDTFLIPSTWREMGIGIHGALGGKADYQLLVMNGLNGEEFSAKNGLRGGRQNLNEDNNRGKAVTGRLELRPITNLYTNLSFYTGNSAPKGAPDAYTTILAFDGKYRISDFELAGEYVQVIQDNPGVLTGDIGHRMSGYWVEGAYHLMPAALKKGKLAEADLVAFARWSEFDTQQGGIADPTLASGKYDRNYTTFGFSFKPVDTVAIKADYQIYGDHHSAGEKPLDNDKFQVTLGFVF
ncbi:porin [Geobacter sp.]|uniref:porin n=1 Tax=Geobacter sp. TaxID=46610 RepID=UPI0026091FFA|nr:porin [Geobacter sp.]